MFGCTRTHIHVRQYCRSCGLAFGFCRKCCRQFDLECKRDTRYIVCDSLSCNLQSLYSCVSIHRIRLSSILDPRRSVARPLCSVRQNKAGNGGVKPTWRKSCWHEKSPTNPSRRRTVFLVRFNSFTLFKALSNVTFGATTWGHH